MILSSKLLLYISHISHFTLSRGTRNRAHVTVEQHSGRSTRNHVKYTHVVHLLTYRTINSGMRNGTCARFPGTRAITFRAAKQQIEWESLPKYVVTHCFVGALFWDKDMCCGCYCCRPCSREHKLCDITYCLRTLDFLLIKFSPQPHCVHFRHNRFCLSYLLCVDVIPQA